MKRINKLKIFFKQFNSPLIYILFVASFISFYLKEMIDGAIILVVIVINGIVSFIQEVKADEALEALKKLSSPHCYIKENGVIKKILSSEIKVNDILVLEEGNIVAADGIIISSNMLQIDESSITGESLRVEKEKNQKVLQSTIVVSGRGEVLVTEVGKNTEFGKLSSFIENKKEITPLQNKLNDLSKILGLSTIVICLIMFIISLFRNGNLFEMLITSISLAVAVIPEGLMAVVTITLSIGVQKLVNVNTIVKHLPSVETLGSVSLVCSDKTGTITENKMIVQKTFTFNSDNYLYQGMLLCNNASLESGDPTEIALLKYAKNKVDVSLIKRIKEIPFSSERKMMKVICKSKKEEFTFSKGAFEVIINECKYLLVDNKIIKMNQEYKKIINKELDSYYENSLRVLAFSININNQEIFIGLVGEKDPLRKGVIESIDKLSNAGIKTIMITGDHLKTAKAIGEELKIVHSNQNICLGDHIDALDDEDFKKVTVFARATPITKMKIISRYKKLNEVVAMTGDGVNDAPSLKEADVGIAMGKNGTEVAKEVSDIILIDDNFSTIEKAIETGRVIYDNIKKAIIFLLSSNLAEVLVMFFCLLLNLPLPLIAIHILWVNLISDSLPALALGSDKPKNNVMLEKPRKKESSIFNNGGLKTTLIYGFVIAFISFVAFIIIPLCELSKNNSLNFSTIYRDILLIYDNEFILAKSRTLAFTVLGISELFHMIGMSDLNSSIISIIKKKNIFLFVVIILGFLLQIIVTEIPLFVDFFKTIPLSLQEWLWASLLACFPLVIHEVLRK